MTTLDLVDLLARHHDRVSHYRGTVRGESKWAVNGPVGIMIHHTAPPNPFPLDVLSGGRDGRLRCNIAPRQNGELVVISAAACNYSSGSGAQRVLDDVRNGVAPTGTAQARGLADTVNGNPWFWNLEVDHPGNGSPLPVAQWRAVVNACVALCKHHGWTAARVIAHGEWTRRKIDPRWDGLDSHGAARVIRAEVHRQLTQPPEPPMPPTEHIAGYDWVDVPEWPSWAEAPIRKSIESGVIRGKDLDGTHRRFDPNAPLTRAEAAALLDRIGALD